MPTLLFFLTILKSLQKCFFFVSHLMTHSYNKSFFSSASPPRNTISHYLRQDVPSAHDEAVPKKIKRPSPRSVLSLDAHTTIKIEKLEGVI